LTFAAPGLDQGIDAVKNLVDRARLLRAEVLLPCSLAAGVERGDGEPVGVAWVADAGECAQHLYRDTGLTRQSGVTRCGGMACALALAAVGGDADGGHGWPCAGARVWVTLTSLSEGAKKSPNGCYTKCSGHHCVDNVFNDASKKASTLLERHFRIQRTGCEVAASNIRLADGTLKHRVCLMRNGMPVSCEVVARNSKLTITQLEQRIRRGLIGPTTDTCRALVALADIAEDFFGAKVA